jgi:hypothetical protein
VEGLYGRINFATTIVATGNKIAMIRKMKIGRYARGIRLY